MAHHQNHQHLRDDDSMDPHKLIDSFIQASREENKRLEFELKYSPSQILALIQKDLGISVMDDLALSSSASSSSFLLLNLTIAHLTSRHDSSEHNMPQHWKDLIRMSISDPQVTKDQPAKTSLGSKLKELESVGVHEEQTQDLNAAAIINSNDSHNLSSTTSITDNSSNTVTPPNLPVSTETSVRQVDPTRPNVTPMPSHSHIDLPMTPSASPPHEDNKLGFTVFAVELLGALTNLAVSSKPQHNQVLIYVVVVCSTLAFSISSTALVLHKKQPKIAKKMQKAAFLIGTFGYLGIMGMLLPSTITWCFTISAFLVCTLMFSVAYWMIE